MTHRLKKGRYFSWLYLQAAVLCLVIFAQTASAQLCQGSLGDPIVWIDFGAGANPGPRLASAATTYNYLAADCPNDGSYTVRNRTDACFGNTWHTVTQDHTGNSNGYFMLVNASFDPGAFYVENVNGLCGNTTYEFAAWVMNVIKASACSGASIQPNLTFTIEEKNGTVLKSFNTGGLPALNTPVWQQHGFFFKTPPAVTDVVVRIVNNAPGGCGNDLALDDITFRPCGPLITPLIDGTAGSNKSFCQGQVQNINLSATISAGFNQPMFQWQQSNDGSNWTDISGATSNNLQRNFTATDKGLFQYRLIAAETGNLNISSCRIASSPIKINIHALPVINAIKNMEACEGQDVKLQAGGGNSYQWTGANGFTSVLAQPVLSPAVINMSGKYVVTVKSAEGCTTKDSTTLSIHPTPAARIFNHDTSICQGDTFRLSSSGSGNAIWSPSAGLSTTTAHSPFVFADTTTTYRLIVRNSFGCADTTSIAINVSQLPKVDAGPDQSIVEGQAVTLQGRLTGEVDSFYWTPTSLVPAPSLTPTANPLTSVKFFLHAKSKNNCGIIKDSAFVKVYRKLKVPNAFSPNGDGINDRWKIGYLDFYQQYDLRVFTRSGNLVYYEYRSSEGWDGKYNGKPLPVGTYYYTIRLFNQPIVTGWLYLAR